MTHFEQLIRRAEAGDPEVLDALNTESRRRHTWHGPLYTLLLAPPRGAFDALADLLRSISEPEAIDTAKRLLHRWSLEQRLPSSLWMERALASLHPVPPLTLLPCPTLTLASAASLLGTHRWVEACCVFLTSELTHQARCAQLRTALRLGSARATRHAALLLGALSESPTDVSALLDATLAPRLDPDCAARAMIQISRRQHAALVPLMEHLQRPDLSLFQDEAAFFATAIEGIGGELSAPHDPHLSTRHMIQAGLAYRRDHFALERLLVEALSPDAITPLLAPIFDSLRAHRPPEEPLRRERVEILGQLPGDEAATLLVHALSDPASSVKTQALLALAQRPSLIEGAETHIAALSSARYVWVRLAAVRALRAHGCSVSAYSHDEDPRVQEALTP